MSEPRDRPSVPATAPGSGKPPTAPGDAVAGAPASTVVPTALDRGAVERVLARAAELQLGSPDREGLLTEAQIVELGGEVGLSPAALRQALAEERTRIAVPVDEGWASRTFGPRLASATRTVPGTPEQAMRRLEVWMGRDECLQVKRRFSDRVTWEPRRDLLGSLRRGLRLGGRGFALASAHEIAATAVPVDEGRTLVRLDADLAPNRQTRLRVGGATAASGVVGGGLAAAAAAMVIVPTAAAIGAVVAVAAIPAIAGVAAGYAVAKQHLSQATRVQLALEQLLDRLEHEPPTPGAPALGPLLNRLLG